MKSRIIIKRKYFERLFFKNDSQTIVFVDKNHGFWFGRLDDRTGHPLSMFLANVKDGTKELITEKEFIDYTLQYRHFTNLNRPNVYPELQISS